MPLVLCSASVTGRFVPDIGAGPPQIKAEKIVIGADTSNVPHPTEVSFADLYDNPAAYDYQFVTTIGLLGVGTNGMGYGQLFNAGYPEQSIGVQIDASDYLHAIQSKGCTILG